MSRIILPSRQTTTGFPACLKICTLIQISTKKLFWSYVRFVKAKKFDRGEDVSSHLDLSRAVRPEWEQKRVDVGLLLWMIQSLDKEARRLGITRQSIIKVRLAERLQHTSAG